MITPARITFWGIPYPEPLTDWEEVANFEAALSFDDKLRLHAKLCPEADGPPSFLGFGLFITFRDDADMRYWRTRLGHQRRAQKLRIARGERLNVALLQHYSLRHKDELTYWFGALFNVARPYSYRARIEVS